MAATWPSGSAFVLLRLACPPATFLCLEYVSAETCKQCIFKRLRFSLEFNMKGLGYIWARLRGPNENGSFIFGLFSWVRNKNELFIFGFDWGPDRKGSFRFGIAFRAEV